MNNSFRSTTTGRRTSSRALSSRFWLIPAAAMSLLPQVNAADVIWDGGSTVDSNWSTAANWQGDVAPLNAALPTSPDVVRLAGGIRLTPVVDAPWAVDTLHFNSGTSTGNFELSGETITFQPSNGTGHDSRLFLVNASGKTQIINNDLVVTPAPGAAANANGSGINVGSGNLILNGNLNIGSISALRFLGGSGTVTINGVISGTPGGATAVNSGATVILNNTNTFTSGFTIWSGTAKVTVDSPHNAPGALGNSTADVTLGHNTLTSGGRLLTSAAVTIGRNITLTRTKDNVAAHTIGGDTAHVSHYTGVIYTGGNAADAASLVVTAAAGGRVNIDNITRRANATLQDTVTKQGIGIVALTGTSNYAGATTVSAGTLLVNGTLSDVSPNSPTVGEVSVSLNATLGGTGEIKRSVVIQDGGILSPGDMDVSGISQGGKLTLGAGLTLGNTSALKFNLGSAAGTSDDEVFITGNLTLDGQLNVSDLGGFGVGSYKLFEYTGVLTNNGITFGDMPAAYTYSIDTTTSAQAVYLNVVPEPGSAALLGLGGALLAARRRRGQGSL